MFKLIKHDIVIDNILIASNNRILKIHHKNVTNTFLTRLTGVKTFPGGLVTTLFRQWAMSVSKESVFYLKLPYYL